MYKLFKNQNGFGAAPLLLVVVVIALMGFIGWYVLKHKNTLNNVSVLTVSSTTPPEKTKSTSSTTQLFQLPSGWQWYANTLYGFKLAYPSSWGQPQTSASKGEITGTDYRVTFSPGPVYNGAVSRNQIMVGFSSDDYSTPGEKGATDGPYANKDAIQTKLDAINSGTWQGGPILAHDTTSFVWLTASSSTHVLEVDRIVKISSLNVSGVFDTYQILDAPSSCSTTALSQNSQQWCINQNILDELNNVLSSIQSS